MNCIFGVPGLEKCVENSNFEELAVENARIVSAIAEGMNCLENQSALETVIMFLHLRVELWSVIVLKH